MPATALKILQCGGNNILGIIEVIFFASFRFGVRRNFAVFFIKFKSIKVT